MATTEHRLYPLPDDTKTVREEIENLQLQVLPMLDYDIHALFLAIADLAAAGHDHVIADITGLVTALEGKMPASTTFSLADLTDTDGVDAAPDGYVMVKSGPLWVAQAALAALGTHGHTLAQVSGLADALSGLGGAVGERMKTTDFAVQFASNIHVATAKALLVDADEFGFWDSVSSALRRLSWANVKAALLAYFVTKFPRVDADQAFTALEQTQLRKNIGLEFGYPLFHAQDQKPSGTLAGSAVAGYNERTLNTILTNEIGAVLASSVITLLPGTYMVWAETSSFNVGASRPIIAKASDASVLLWGSPVSSPVGNQSGLRSVVQGRLTVAGAPLDIKLRQYTASAGANSGLGATVAIAGVYETYSEILIWKLK